MTFMGSFSLSRPHEIGDHKVRGNKYGSLQIILNSHPDSRFQRRCATRPWFVYLFPTFNNPRLRQLDTIDVETRSWHVPKCEMSQLFSSWPLFNRPTLAFATPAALMENKGLAVMRRCLCKFERPVMIIWKRRSLSFNGPGGNAKCSLECINVQTAPGVIYGRCFSMDSLNKSGAGWK